MDDGVFIAMNFIDNCGTTLPNVSILLPNLNTRPFLVERLDSILGQTLQNWELIVVDSYSDDGAWELLQEYATRDSRFRLSQAPRDGIYPNLNRCITRARGAYIYIATGDDTMSPDCLETMVTALDAHPDCGICHTCLHVIDAEGKEIPNFIHKLRPALFYGELLQKPHIRFAPYDGILHCALHTVYTSLTQLLIRHSVFDTIGPFRAEWGAEGDFEWEMRAALRYNVLHIPYTGATWRIHDKQATRLSDRESSAKTERSCRMITAALSGLEDEQPENYPRNLRQERLLFPYRRQYLISGMQERHSFVQKLGFLLRCLFISPKAVRDFLRLRFCRNIRYIDDLTYIRTEIRRLGLEHCVQTLEETVERGSGPAEHSEI